MKQKITLSVICCLSLNLLFAEGPYSGKINGVDFSRNQILVPNYNLSKNLLRNPSFEDGFDYWALAPRGGQKARKDTIETLTLDSSTSVSGRYSLRQNPTTGRWDVPFSFAVPLKQHEFYTLSFYAKSDAPEKSNVIAWIMTDDGNKRPMSNRFALTETWQRFSFTFKSPMHCASVMLGNMLTKTAACTVWLDDVQLERGKKATSFEMLPGTVRLCSNSREHLSQPGTKANARLLIQTAKPETGELFWRIEDFFGKIRSKGKTKFSTINAFVPVQISLPVCDSLPSGSYVVKSTIKLSGGFEETFCARLTRMDFLNGTHRHRALFSAYNQVHYSFPNWLRTLDILKKAGIGSLCSFALSSPELETYIPKYGMFLYAIPFGKENNTDALGKFNLTRTNATPQPSWDKKLTLNDVKEEDIPLIAAECRRNQEAHPTINVWKTVNEPFCHTTEDIKKMVQILKAVRAEMKKANPKAVILTPDTGNNAHAIGYLDTFFKYGGKDAVDAVGQHFYTGPNSLDREIQELFSLVDKYAPGMKFYSTEGGYFENYVIPDLGFPFVMSGGDSYWANCLSYDIGTGERISLGMQSYYWLTMLKHAGRMVTAQDWNYAAKHRIFMGIDQVPTSLIFAVNTAAKLLGNSKFSEDIHLQKGIAGYLFDDGSGRPVATLINKNNNVLSGKNSTPALDLSRIGIKIEMFNCMGEQIPANQPISLDGLPFYIRGEKGKFAELKSRLEHTKIKFPDQGKQLEYNYTLKKDGTLTIKFGNRYHRTIKGMLYTEIHGEIKNRPLRIQLAPEETLTKKFKLPPAEFNITNKRIILRFQPDDGPMEFHDIVHLAYCKISKAPATFKIDGDWNKWNRAATNENNTRSKGTKEDYSMNFRLLWNEKNLYLAFAFQDKTFAPSRSIQFPDKGDSVTLYFDSWLNRSDAVPGLGLDYQGNYPGFDQDDHYYDILLNPEKDKSLHLVRRHAAYWQLAFNYGGDVPDVRSLFEKQDEGYRFEMAIPAIQLQPIHLKEGESFGLNIQTRDFDEKRCVGMTWQNGGESPCNWRPPQYYTIFFLDK